MERKEKSELALSNEILDLFANLQIAENNDYIQSVKKLEFPNDGKLQNKDVCFFKIEQLSFDEDYPHREAFENVLLSMNSRMFNFVYVLTGTKEGIELCIGVVRNQNEKDGIWSAANYGNIIANVFEGNFSGSKLKKLSNVELDELIGDGVQKYESAGTVIGIPSINKKDSGEEYDFQGIDRLVNSMLGLEWRLAVVCEPVSKTEVLEIREDIYELYNRLSVYSKLTLQHSQNDAGTISFGKNQSDSKGKNWGYNKSESKSSGKQGETWNSGTSHTEGNSEGESRDHSEGKNSSFSMNRGSSNSVTLEIANKHAVEIMEYINEDLLERLKKGYSKGLFKTAVYYMAEKPTYANRLKGGIISLFQGNNSTYSPLYSQDIDLKQDCNKQILQTYQNQYLEEQYSNDALLLLGRPFDKNYIGLNSYLTTDEISLIAGLPQKEVPGLTLKAGVEFGLNEKELDKTNAINLGSMVRKGRELVNIPFYLSKDSMAKHTFIAGVTGSGKTTTCHRLLSEAKMPFLVIEPAKTEYRTLIRQDKELVVFTLGNEMVSPFRINPFELIQGEVISAHVDMLKATFTSAFPMEASMPQLLEEAIYKCYQKKGWNIDTNENEEYGDSAFDTNVNSFPIMSDLLNTMQEVVESKHFSQQMQSDYIGSLVSRLSNLTVGSKGSMLNCSHSIDFEYIVHHNVVLEMEELKSPEDKALFMGFILSRLSAVIKNEHKKNRDFKHLTLIEEAHRLLSKVEYGDSGSKKVAVETFTDLLAEVRKYGEGLIIVDQIPNKLASEVLKNTNTKIIHKILARDDKEAVGDTMLMDDKQKEYLSALPVGHTIVFSEHTEKPIHVHIKAISDTSEEQVEDDVVKERFLQQKEKIGGCYEFMEIAGVYPVFEEVIALVRKGCVDEKIFSRMRMKIARVSERYGMQVEDVWKKMLGYRDDILGFASVNQEVQKEKITLLTEFFTKIFYDENFGENDILSNRKLCSFLNRKE